MLYNAGLAKSSSVVAAPELALDLVLEALTTGPFAVNTYLLGDAAVGQAVVVDPGGEVASILSLLQRHGLALQAILTTHAHIDHLAAAHALQSQTGAPLWMHDDARKTLATLGQQAAWFGLEPVVTPAVNGALRAGQVLNVGGIALEVRHTPGHAAGHVTLVSAPLPLASGVARLAFCGDVVFEGSIGRTDLPGGDYEQLMHSIEQEILSLPDDTVLLPGHGPATTVGQERFSNPFILDWLARRGRPAGRAGAE